MSEKQIKQLIKKRATLKGKLTNFAAYLKSIKSSDNVNDLQIQIELQLRLDKIENLYEDFDAFQCELEELSDDPEEQRLDREAFEVQYYSLVSAGRAIIESHRKQS